MACSTCPQQKYTLRNALRDYIAEDFVSDWEKSQRLEICNKCKHLKFGTNCKLCGCFVAVKAKFRGAFCDEGRW